MDFAGISRATYRDDTMDDANPGIGFGCGPDGQCQRRWRKLPQVYPSLVGDMDPYTNDILGCQCHLLWERHCIISFGEGPY